MKVKKKFDYKGIELQIVDREEPYLNSGETITMTRVIAPNGGIIPVKITTRQTLASIALDTIKLLDTIAESGVNVEEELTKRLLGTDNP